MRIIGLDELTSEELVEELDRGARFVIYQYCISIVLLTFKNPSNVYFVRADESAVAKGLGFTILSLLLGWWGIPWGPIHTIASVATNLGGGKDVTGDVIAALQEPEPSELTPSA